MRHTHTHTLTQIFKWWSDTKFFICLPQLVQTVVIIFHRQWLDLCDCPEPADSTGQSHSSLLSVISALVKSDINVNAVLIIQLLKSLMTLCVLLSVQSVLQVLLNSWSRCVCVSHHKLLLSLQVGPHPPCRAPHLRCHGGAARQRLCSESVCCCCIGCCYITAASQRAAGHCCTCTTRWSPLYETLWGRSPNWERVKVHTHNIVLWGLLVKFRHFMFNSLWHHIPMTIKQFYTVISHSSSPQLNHNNPDLYHTLVFLVARCRVSAFVPRFLLSSHYNTRDVFNFSLLTDSGT